VSLGPGSVFKDAERHNGAGSEDPPLRRGAWKIFTPPHNTGFPCRDERILFKDDREERRDKWDIGKELRAQTGSQHSELNQDNACDEQQGSGKAQDADRVLDNPQ
jgi:hypothetical protein